MTKAEEEMIEEYLSEGFKNANAEREQFTKEIQKTVIMHRKNGKLLRDVCDKNERNATRTDKTQ